MRRVRYNGLRPMGTLRPRRMWSPGEVLEVDDDVAEELARENDFELVSKPVLRVRGRRPRRTRRILRGRM